MKLFPCLLPFVMLLPASAQAPSLFKPGAPFALLRQSWIEDLEAHRLFASVSRYAPDATFLSGDGTHAEGIAAIRGLFQYVFDHFDATITMTSRTTSESGDLAYDSGSYVEALADKSTHTLRHIHGDYLTIYRRQPGLMGWTIVQQAWSQAADAETSAEQRQK